MKIGTKRGLEKGKEAVLAGIRGVIGHGRTPIRRELECGVFQRAESAVSAAGSRRLHRVLVTLDGSRSIARQKSPNHQQELRRGSHRGSITERRDEIPTSPPDFSRIRTPMVSRKWTPA
jgi:hypothetical protein